MEIDEVFVKDNPGLCRCCLSEGCYKDLASNYAWMGDTEIYADMLLECFDISISQQVEGPNGLTRLICEVCITRLRDACNFKKQVVESENKFIDMIGRGEFRQKVYETSITKQELTFETEETDGTEPEYLHGADYTEPDEDDEVLANLATTSRPQETPKRSRGRPKKTTGKTTPSKTKVKAEKKKVVKEEGKKARGKRKLKEPGAEEMNLGKWFKTTRSSLENQEIFRKNIIQVLKLSTVMPFRWLKSSYRCFYCYNIYEETEELRRHHNEHSEPDIDAAVANFHETVIYVDVSNIACQLCSETIHDLYKLIDHLVEKHGVIFNKDVGINILGFKLENRCICVTCGVSFQTFGPLLTHTNKNHKGAAILCDICGQHFKHANLLRLHVKSTHEVTRFICSDCGLDFDVKSKLMSHKKVTHNKKHKCLVCNEAFDSYYKRQLHMTSQHKRSEIKCQYCTKTFVFRSMMLSHLRLTHLKERNFACSVCGFKAFSSYKLKNHMYKHSGEKNFKCEVCDKAFTTKKIMRAHFLRVHKQRNFTEY